MESQRSEVRKKSIFRRSHKFGAAVASLLSSQCHLVECQEVHMLMSKARQRHDESVWARMKREFRYFSFFLNFQHERATRSVKSKTNWNVIRFDSRGREEKYEVLFVQLHYCSVVTSIYLLFDSVTRRCGKDWDVVWSCSTSWEQQQQQPQFIFRRLLLVDFVHYMFLVVWSCWLLAGWRRAKKRAREERWEEEWEMEKYFSSYREEMLE